MLSDPFLPRRRSLSTPHGILDPCCAVQSQGSLSPPHSEAAAPGDQLGRVRRRSARPRQPDRVVHAGGGRRLGGSAAHHPGRATLLLRSGDHDGADTLLHGYANPLKRLDTSESVNLHKCLILLDSCWIHATRCRQTEGRGNAGKTASSFFHPSGPSEFGYLIQRTSLILQSKLARGAGRTPFHPVNPGCMIFDLFYLYYHPLYAHPEAEPARAAEAEAEQRYRDLVLVVRDGVPVRKLAA